MPARVKRHLCGLPFTPVSLSHFLFVYLTHRYAWCSCRATKKLEPTRRRCPCSLSMYLRPPTLDATPTLPRRQHESFSPAAATSSPHLASSMACRTSEVRAWLEAESLLNLCRLADKHSVSIDNACETKEAVVRALLDAREGLWGQPGALPPSPSATPMAMDVDEESGGQVGTAYSLVVQ